MKEEAHEFPLGKALVYDKHITAVDQLAVESIPAKMVMRWMNLPLRHAIDMFYEDKELRRNMRLLGDIGLDVMDDFAFHLKKRPSWYRKKRR